MRNHLMRLLGAASVIALSVSCTAAQNDTPTEDVPAEEVEELRGSQPHQPADLSDRDAWSEILSGNPENVDEVSGAFHAYAGSGGGDAAALSTAEEVIDQALDGQSNVLSRYLDQHGGSIRSGTAEAVLGHEGYHFRSALTPVTIYWEDKAACGTIEEHYLTLAWVFHGAGERRL